MSSPFFTIYHEEKPYHIHSLLLEMKAPNLYQKAHSMNWRMQRCILYAGGPAAVQQFCLWLYQDTIDKAGEVGPLGYTTVYRLAAWDIKSFKNHAVGKIRLYCQGYKIAPYVLQNPSEELNKIDGKMARFLIDQLACEIVVCGSDKVGSEADFGRL
jgi:hypothetical protein